MIRSMEILWIKIQENALSYNLSALTHSQGAVLTH